MTTTSINDPALDPCQASTPLFKTGSTMFHHKYDFTNPASPGSKHNIAGTPSCSTDGFYYNVKASTFVDHVFVYGFMYAVIGGAYATKNTCPGGGCGYSCCTDGISCNSILQHNNYMVWKITGSPSLLKLEPYKDFYPQQVNKMAGLELYGFYAHTLDSSNVGHLWLLQLTMNVNISSGLLPTDGVYTENTTAPSPIKTEQFYTGSLDQIPL